MKDFEIKLVPENSYYPVHDITFSDGIYNHTMTNPNTDEVTNSTGSVMPKMYHGSYDFGLTSDWYEDIAGEVVISGEDSKIVAGLNTRVGEITVNVDFDAPAGQVDTDTIVKIDGTLDTHRVVKYADVGYLVEAEKQFYEPETYTVFINPDNQTETVNLFLERKQSVWTEQSRTEPVPFETQYNEDINVRPENSYIEVHGVDGIETFIEEREYIESVWTGLIRNQTSTVTTQPITQIELIGTAVIEWEERTRTETEPYETTYVETDELYEGETEIGTPGRNRTTVYAWEVELMNGEETGARTEEYIKSNVSRIDEVVLVGTKIRSILSDTPILNDYGQYYYPWLELPIDEVEYIVTSHGKSGTLLFTNGGYLTNSRGGSISDGVPKVLTGYQLNTSAFVTGYGVGTSVGVEIELPLTYTLTVEEVT